MRMLSIAIILLAAAPAMAQPGLKPSPQGDWRGVGFQVGVEGPQASWDIELSIAPDMDGVVVYPSLGCKGVLHPVPGAPDQAAFTEEITEGDCINGGRISVIRENGRLFWFWTKRGVNADASAVLYPSQQIG